MQIVLDEFPSKGVTQEVLCQFKETADQTQKDRTKATIPSICCYFLRFENTVTSCFLNTDGKHVLDETNLRYLSYGRSLLKGNLQSNRLLFRQSCESKGFLDTPWWLEDETKARGREGTRKGSLSGSKDRRFDYRHC